MPFSDSLLDPGFRRDDVKQLRLPLQVVMPAKAGIQAVERARSVPRKLVNSEQETGNEE